MAMSNESYDSSNDEDVDLTLNMSFEELRIKIRFDNTDNAIVIDSNHYFFQYPPFNLKTYLQSSFKRSHKKPTIMIREFQSTHNFATKDNKIHQHILTKNRKERRESYFEKKRNEYSDSHHEANDYKQMNKMPDMLELLPKWVTGCNSNHAATQFECTQRIRKLLSIERIPPIDAVIDSGVVPRLIEFLQYNNERLQFEAAWVITNIACGAPQNTQYIIDNGVVPIFIQLLTSKCIEIQEQSAWGLGNIAGDSVHCRDIILEHNVLTNLMPLLLDIKPTEFNLSLRQTITWTLSNLCRGETSSLQMVYVKQIIDVLNKLFLIEDQDTEILQDIVWSYTYLFAGEYTNIVIGNINESGYLFKTELLIHGYLRAIRETELDSMEIPNDITTLLILFAPIADIYISCDIFKKLIQLLSNMCLQQPTVRAIHDILASKTENNNTRQLCIDYGILKKLECILKYGTMCVQREVCSLINNMVIDAPHSIIDMMIDEGIFDIMIVQILNHDTVALAKQALFAVGNVMRHGNDQHIKIMVGKGVIEAIGNMKQPIMAIMNCMENIIEVEDGKYIETVKDCENFLQLLKESMFENDADSAETILSHSLLTKLM